MSAITFTVHGRPRPQGSKRALKHPATDKIVMLESAELRAWRQEVAGEAASAGDGRRLDGPVMVEVRFVFRRPKAHFGTGRNAERLKDWAPVWHSQAPDIDKLCRAVADSLTGVLIGDDGQIAVLSAWKAYGWPERCEVTVGPVADSEALREAA